MIKKDFISFINCSKKNSNFGKRLVFINLKRIFHDENYESEDVISTLMEWTIDDFINENDCLLFCELYCLFKTLKHFVNKCSKQMFHALDCIFNIAIKLSIKNKPIDSFLFFSFFGFTGLPRSRSCICVARNDG